MSKKRKVWIAGVSGIVFIIFSFCYGAYNQMNSINGNNEDGIIKSIAYLHKDYIKDIDEIKIIDEFNYDSDKIILFKYYELTGVAKFNKNTSGRYEIVFVETLDGESERKVSKVS